MTTHNIYLINMLAQPLMPEGIGEKQSGTGSRRRHGHRDPEFPIITQLSFVSSIRRDSSQHSPLLACLLAACSFIKPHDIHIYTQEQITDQEDPNTHQESYEKLLVLVLFLVFEFFIGQWNRQGWNRCSPNAKFNITATMLLSIIAISDEEEGREDSDKAQEKSVTPSDVTLKHHKPPRTPAPSQLQSVHRPTASSFWMDEVS